jgi:hypothetical protein
VCVFGYLILNQRKNNKMYKCTVTSKFSKPGEKCNKLVVETRPRTYAVRERNMETGYWEDFDVGTGSEIVKEVNASDEGVKVWNSWDTEQKALFLDELYGRK